MKFIRSSRGVARLVSAT